LLAIKTMKNTNFLAMPPNCKAFALLMRGFSLIELLVTMAMIAILLAIAVPTFSDLRINQKVASNASDLFASTIQARNEAMRLSRQVTIAPTDASSWNNGWQVFVDMDRNGSLDSGTDTLVTTAPAITENITITNGAGTTPTASISFDSRGFLVGVSNTKFIFKSAVTQRERQVIISPTGRARLCDPHINSTCSSGT
jgi:type IV fimbrial biogenesis protein FimT